VYLIRRLVVVPRHHRDVNACLRDLTGQWHEPVDEHWFTNRGISLFSHVTQLYMVFCRTLTWSKYIATCAGHTLINRAVKDLCCKGFDIDYLWKWCMHYCHIYGV